LTKGQKRRRRRRRGGGGEEEKEVAVDIAHWNFDHTDFKAATLVYRSRLARIHLTCSHEPSIRLR